MSYRFLAVLLPYGQYARLSSGYRTRYAGRRTGYRPQNVDDTPCFHVAVSASQAVIYTLSFFSKIRFSVSGVFILSREKPP